MLGLRGISGSVRSVAGCWGGILGRRLPSSVAGLALVLVLGFWLRPYALSAYHTEAGGRALDAALVPVFPDRLAPEQVVDAARLRASVAHLQEACWRDPRNVQALRLLARASLSGESPGGAGGPAAGGGRAP